MKNRIMKLIKYKLGEILDVKRGASLNGEYYAKEGMFHLHKT